MLPLCQEIETALYQHLEGMTLAQLCDQAYAWRASAQSGGRKADAGDRQDFII